MAPRSSILGAPLLLALVSLIPAAVHAEPVRITDGFITIYGDGVATMDIGGRDFSAGIVFNGGGGFGNPIRLTVGTVADLDPVVGVASAAGIGRIDGVRIQDPNHPEGFFQISGIFNFNTVPIVVRDEDPSALFVTFTPRFTMSGTVSGRTQAGEELFNVPVIGRGTARFLLRRFETEDGVTFVQTPQLNSGFQFESGEAPVPEPTSILLLGSGLLGVVLRRCRSN